MTKLNATMNHVAVRQLIAHVRTPLYRNAYALMINSVMTSALGMLYWVIAARYYATDVVGLNSAALSATLFLGGVSALYLDGALMRFLPEMGEKRASFIRLAYLASLVAGVVVTIVFLLGLGVWSPALSFLTLSPWWLLAFAEMTIVTGISQVQDGAMTGLRESVWVAHKNILGGAIKVVLLIIFARILPDFGILASWLAPGVLLVIPIQILIERRLVHRSRRPAQAGTTPVRLRLVTGYVAGNYVASLCNLAATMLLPLLVVSLAGAQAGAYFYLPWMIANALRLVTQGMSQSLTVEGATDYQQVGKYGRAALRHTARLLLPMVALLVIGAPFLLRIFGHNYAEEGAQLLQLLALGMIPNAVVVLYLGIARVHNHIWRVVGVQALQAVLIIGMSYVLLQHYGIVGVGWASLVSSALVAVALLVTDLRPILRSTHLQGQEV
ncbi:MAG: hypothetical protein U0822_14520 [Anaerolineae bacterium]